jgi:integrase
MTSNQTSQKKRHPSEKGLKPMHNAYYHRYTLHGKDKLIPLKTSDLKIAIKRNIEVLENLSDIKSHKEVYLYWLDDILKTESDISIKSIGKLYIKTIRQNGIKESTIDIYKRMIMKFIDTNGNLQITKITINHIDVFQGLFQNESKPLSPHYCNINLRALKRFLNWCKEREYLSKIPTIKQIRVPRPEPKYINNIEYEAIMDHLSPYMNRVVHLYRSTGMRLNEALNGEIRGKYFVISAEKYKTNRTHSFPINDDLKAILVEMQDKSHRGEYYSKAFKKACLKAGIHDKHFHCLRHTFALRTYLQKNDIYIVKKLLGHSSITTTEKYADFDIERLSDDFPDLVNNDPDHKTMNYGKFIQPIISSYIS